MPTYVYRFVETGETIEVQQGFHDDALTEATHPMTGAVLAVKKVFQPVGISFKGSGFYKTDSRTSSKSSSSSSTATSSTDAGSSSSDAPASSPSSTSGSSGSDTSTSTSTSATPKPSTTTTSTAAG